MNMLSSSATETRRLLRCGVSSASEVTRMRSFDGSTTLRSSPISARSCVIAAIATGAGGIGEHGRFVFRLRQHDGGGRPAKSSENKGCGGTLTRYVSLSGKAAPRPCARVIRELRPATNVL